MKKKTYVLGMAVLVAALLALSGVAQSAMWVGAELGGNYTLPVNTTVGGMSTTTSINPSVIGGATLGYDFVNSGFGAYAWPDWMKYFSVATDITFNRLEINAGTGGVGNVIAAASHANGYEVAWAFMVMAHYGFFPDSEIPGGRVNPYIGVGPALLFTGADFTLPTFRRTAVTNSHFSSSAVNIALAVEPGIRWVLLPNVSVDTAMRYRYAAPSWDAGNNVTIKSTVNQLAFLVRANYHF